MPRELLVALLPWSGLLLAGVAALWLIVRILGAKADWRSLARLHRDEEGAVQSLAFVVTIPVFVMVLMLVVQVSQLMIAIATVHYSAYAAARSAIVWIPANIGEPETESRIGSYYPDPDEDLPGDGQVYSIAPVGPKYDKIHLAAAMACAAVCPSRDLGYAAGGGESTALRTVYAALDPNSSWNTRIPARLANKLAYSLANTEVKISFLHRDDEPPLMRWDIPPDRDEFYPNEVGWQDPVKVTVRHKFALLPGPGRLLATSTASTSGRDRVAEGIERVGRTFVRELTYSVTMNNEGEKSVLPFRHHLP